jgi:hypothetical protein
MIPLYALQSTCDSTKFPVSTVSLNPNWNKVLRMLLFACSLGLQVLVDGLAVRNRGRQLIPGMWTHLEVGGLTKQNSFLPTAGFTL